MVRRMEPGDRQAYLNMAERFYRSDAVSHAVPASYHARTFDELLRSDVYVQGYLLELDGKAAGYALTSRSYSAEAGGMTLWIEELFVLPAYRGRGLGRAFFAHLRAHALQGVARLRLELTNGNARARALYEREGFVPLAYEQMVCDLAPAASREEGE